MLKRLFGYGKAIAVDTKNEAGGRAYAFSPEHALAQIGGHRNDAQHVLRDGRAAARDDPRARREGIARVRGEDGAVLP